MSTAVDSHPSSVAASSVCGPSSDAAAEPVATATAAPAAAALSINVEFSGGLELLFGRQKRLPLSFPASSLPSDGASMRWLIDVLKEKHCQERSELFVAEDSVRPGILVLINDTDWELEDGLEYILKNGDNIVFISTLHGG